MNRFIVLFAAVLFFSQNACALQGGVVTVNGVPYVDLEAFSKTHGLEYAWEPLTKTATVRGPNGEARFHVGSGYVLSFAEANGRSPLLEKLEGPARFFHGSVVAPASVRVLLDAVAPRVSAAPPAAVAPAAGSGVAVHRAWRVVIDAGHGGKDLGAVNAVGVREKDLVLRIAQKIKEGLRARGAEVILTRGADFFIPLAERSRIANKKGADFFVSIHANASPTKSLRGFEIYFLSEATDDQALAVERAENSALRFETAQVQDLDRTSKAIVWDLKEGENRRESLVIANHLAREVGRAAGVSERRIRAANFHVLKWAECPAALVEVGYLTNREDARLLGDETYCRRLADGIVNGLAAYMEEFERTEGFTK